MKPNKLKAILKDCYINKQLLLIAGIGGFTSVADHIAAELVVRLREGQEPSPALSLTNSSIITAICNDYSPDQMFSRQIEAYQKLNPTALLLSGSGTSPAIVTAAMACVNLGIPYLLCTHNGNTTLNAEYYGYDTASCQDEVMQTVHDILWKLTTSN